MVAFAVSIIVTVILVWGFYAYQRRCPAEKEFTWGEAMLFATYVFFILFWVYGVVPVSYTHLTLPTIYSV